MNLSVKLSSIELTALLAVITGADVPANDLFGLLCASAKKTCIAKLHKASVAMQLKQRKCISVTFTLSEAAFIDLVEFDEVSMAVLDGYFQTASAYHKILAKTHQSNEKAS